MNSYGNYYHQDQRGRVTSTIDLWRSLSVNAFNLCSHPLIPITGKLVADILKGSADVRLLPSKKEEKHKFLQDVEEFEKLNQVIHDQLESMNQEILSILASLTQNNLPTYTHSFNTRSNELKRKKDTLWTHLERIRNTANTRIAHLKEKLEKYDKLEKAKIDADNLKFLLRPLYLTSENIEALQQHNTRKKEANTKEYEKLTNFLAKTAVTCQKIETLEASNENLRNIVPQIVTVNDTCGQINIQLQEVKTQLERATISSLSSVKTASLDTSITNIEKTINSVSKLIIQAIQKFGCLPVSPTRSANTSPIMAPKSIEEDFSIIEAEPKKAEDINSVLISSQWTLICLKVRLLKKEINILKLTSKLTIHIREYSKTLETLSEEMRRVRKGESNLAVSTSNYQTSKTQFDDICQTMSKTPDGDISLFILFQECERRIKNSGNLDQLITYLNQLRSNFYRSQLDSELEKHKVALKKIEDDKLEEINKLWNICKEKASTVWLELDLRSERLSNPLSKPTDATKGYALKTTFRTLHPHVRHSVGTETLFNPFDLPLQPAGSPSGAQKEIKPPQTSSEDKTV